MISSSKPKLLPPKSLASGQFASPLRRTSSRSSTGSVTCRCLLTFTVTIGKKIATATRLSFRTSQAVQPHPQPVFTLRRRSLILFALEAFRSKPLHCTSASEPSSLCERKMLKTFDLHAEHYTLPAATAEAINTALREGATHHRGRDHHYAHARTLCPVGECRSVRASRRASAASALGLYEHLYQSGL